MIVSVLGAIAWSAAAGLLAWAVLPRPRPGLLPAFLSGLAGWTTVFAADELAGIHALHPSRPESLLPAATVALLILLTIKRRDGRRQRRTIFF